MRFVVVLQWCDDCGADISGNGNRKFCDDCRRQRHRMSDAKLRQTPARRAYKAAHERARRARVREMAA